MAFEMLYPTEDAQVHRHSSIDQFKGFLSIWKQGGASPIVFEQLDGINCKTVKSHPVVISWGNDLGFVFPEAHCTYASDHFIYTDKEGVEKKLLPECFGGGGEFYDKFIKSFSFTNFDGPNGGSSLGVHEAKTLRTGLSYVICDKSLPPVE